MSIDLKKIERLLKGNPKDINGYLRVVSREVSLDNTCSKVHYHNVRDNKIYCFYMEYVLT